MLNDALPNVVDLPNSCYEVMKIIRGLGLDYFKIDVCVNDCMLFWNEHLKVDNYVAYKSSKWKYDDKAKRCKNIP